MDWKAAVAAPLMAIVVAAGAAGLSPPTGWSHSVVTRGGGGSGAYVIGIDSKTLFQGQRSISIQSQNAPLDVTSSASAIQYARGYQGRRVRFSGWLHTEDVKNWAGVFMQVSTDGTERYFGSALQSLKETDLPFGTGSAGDVPGWTEVSVVLDFPTDPKAMVSMGAVVVGQGKAWLSAMRFEEVGPGVPVTTSRIGVDIAAYNTLRGQQHSQAQAVRAPVQPEPPKLSLD